MNKDLINISAIETYLNGIIDNVVSDNTYIGYLPDSVPSTWNDMIMIDCPTSISDFNAYGSGLFLIWLYAKPFSTGGKNVPVLSRMEKKLNEVIKEANNLNYIISRKRSYSDYDTARKWHCNIIELNITII